MAKTRRVALWIAGSIVVIVAALAMVASFHRPPYAFLDRFHPRKTRVDMVKVFAREGIASKAPIPTITILEFNVEDGPAVLKAMQKELTPARGFNSRNENGISIPDSTEARWQFAQGTLPPPTSSVVPKEASYYMRGTMATFTKEFLIGSAGAGKRPIPPKPGSPSACIVLLAHDETWVERTIGAVRVFFHFPD